ncbi:MAG: TRAP transporter substrate-binding protein DctP [Hyphomicrobiales bacterium]|nr:TRAP transporter substrate-binding protein DctP [Hyphomicrobiales bacterium]
MIRRKFGVTLSKIIRGSDMITGNSTLPLRAVAGSGRALVMTAAAISMSGWAAPAAQAATNIVLNEFVPPRDPMNTKVINPWTRDVTKATDGRVTFTILPTSVAAPDQLWPSVQNGIVDAAYLFNGLVANQLPLEQIAALPFIPGTSQARSLAIWRTYKRFFAAKGEYRPVKLLAIFSQPVAKLYSMKKPVTKPADLVGMRVWALPGVPQKLFEGTGAGVVSRPAVQMSELVTGGTVDAVAGLSAFSISRFKVMPYMKYETDFPGGLTSATFSFIINRSKWLSIPAADRKIIEKLSGEALDQRFNAVDQDDEVAEKQALAGGVKVVKPTPELIALIKKQGAPLYAAWIAKAKSLGVDGKAALAYFIAQCAHPDPAP